MTLATISLGHAGVRCRAEGAKIFGDLFPQKKHFALKDLELDVVRHEFDVTLNEKNNTAGNVGELKFFRENETFKTCN